MKDNSLKERSYKEFRHLIGERCEVIDRNGKKITGRLYFAGRNATFGFEQVTINRTPVRHPQMSTLKKCK